ncbi:MAG: hypothetical protein AAF433_04405 [Bacteroidota bacterium]
MLQHIFNLHLRTNQLLDNRLRTVQLRLPPATRQLMENTGLMKRKRDHNWEIYAPEAAAGLASLLPANDQLEFEFVITDPAAFRAIAKSRSIYLFRSETKCGSLSSRPIVAELTQKGLLARVVIKLSDLLNSFTDKAIDYELRLP